MKTMQKRLALALAAVLMMALLTGCASGASAASPTATAELTAQPTAEAVSYTHHPGNRAAPLRICAENKAPRSPRERGAFLRLRKN